MLLRFASIALVLCLVCCSCGTSTQAELQAANATLIVLGETIDGAYAHIDFDRQRAEVSLIAVAQALGAEVTWKSQSKAELVFVDTTYRLNLRKEELVDVKRKDVNLLMISPGAQGGEPKPLSNTTLSSAKL